MKFKSAIVVASFLSVTILFPLVSTSQTPSAVGKQAEPKAGTSSEMAQGEVQKIDKETGSLTIKHGEIKNVGMSAMTMAFPVKDKSMLNNVKAGDKIRFKAINDNGKIVVTEIQADK